MTVLSWRKLAASVLALSLAACVGGVTHSDQIAADTAQGLGSTSVAAISTAVDQAILAEMDANHIPGAAVAIVHRGRTVHLRGFGVADAATGAPVDPDRTVFRIGSISKALTLLTLSRLIDDGRVSRTDDVARYLSQIENPGGFRDPITLDHLLTHTTGFDQPGYGRQIAAFERPLAERQAQRPSLEAFLREGALRRVNPAGSYFRYDTYGPTLAGLILEAETGLDYADAMRVEMFEPLGMTRSSVEITERLAPDLAQGHGFVDGAYVPTPYEVYLTRPASSIDATPADMARLLEALTGDGANATGRFLSPDMVERIRAAHYRPHPEFAGMTHGLWESTQVGVGSDAAPVRTLGHGGDMWGFNAGMTWLPDYDLAFFVVANRNGEGGGGPVNINRVVLRALADALVPGQAPVRHPIPDPRGDHDLEAYAGDYFWGVFCHTCTPEEFDQGAWARPPATVVRVVDGALELHGERFLLQSGDVFVRADGYRRVFFNRFDDGAISSFSYDDDPTAFERGVQPEP